MPLTLEQYASYLDTRDVPWPAPPAVERPKARAHLAALPDTRVVSWNVYGTLLNISGGELYFEHPQKFIMDVALDKTVQEFKMWGAMTRKPGQPAEYLGTLPTDRRTTIEKARSLVRGSLPKGYEEGMGGGMIMYAIPLSEFPDTYNGHPLCYVALASQKNYCALYLMAAYGSPKQRTVLKDGFKRAGKKLDMGKSCVRFKRLDDLALDVIAEAIKRVPAKKYIEHYETALKRWPESKDLQYGLRRSKIHFAIERRYAVGRVRPYRER